MSLVVTDLSVEQARRVIARINGTTAELVELIELAWTGRAWLALGYESWAALCDAEIQVPQLDRERRVEMIGALRSVGMSTRAIGAATGVNDRTVRRDLNSGAANAAPDEPITGVDGKSYPPAPRERVGRSPVDDMVDDVFGRAGDPTKGLSDAVMGRHKAPEPKPQQPRRSPLPEAANRAGWELRKAVERIQTIFADDRFPNHREQMTAGLRSHLSYATETLPSLLGGLDHQPLED